MYVSLMKNCNHKQNRPSLCPVGIAQVPLSKCCFYSKNVLRWQHNGKGNSLCQYQVMIPWSHNGLNAVICAFYCDALVLRITGFWRMCIGDPCKPKRSWLFLLLSWDIFVILFFCLIYVQNLRHTGKKQGILHLLMRISLHQHPSLPRVTTGTDASCYTLRTVANKENLQHTLYLHFFYIQGVPNAV